MISALLQVDGLWCGGCARALEKKLAALPGVSKVSVHLESSTAGLDFEPALTSLEQIVREAKRLGYGLVEVDWTGQETTAPLESQVQDLSRRLAVGSLLAMWVMLCTVPTYSFTRDVLLFPRLEPSAARGMGLVALVLSAILVTYSGAPFHRMSWRWLKVGMSGTDQLVSLGAIASWGLSVYRWWNGEYELYCDGACLLILLLLTARLIDHSARLKGQKALAALLREAPERYLDKEGRWCSAKFARAGETEFHLQSGSRVPLDGVILSGEGWCDSSLLDGESLPRPVKSGDLLYAGTVLTGGDVRVKCQRVPGERRLDLLAATMRRTRAEQGSLAGLSEKAAMRVGALLLGGAGLVFIQGWVDPMNALERGVALLVVGCPCALTLAVPLVVRTVTEKAVELGISFKNGMAIERLYRLKDFVFDKTGTLSEGKPSLNRVLIREPGWTEAGALNRAAALSSGNPHPLSEVLRACAAQSAFCSETELEVVPGKGVHRGGTCLGSAAFLTERGIEVVASETTSCELAVDGRWVATFEFEDRLNPEALNTVEKMVARGGRVLVASGDRQQALLPLLNSGIPWKAVEGGLSPEEKVARVDRNTVFVGDGINDSLALSRAGVGVAVGQSTPASIEAADLHLRDITLLPLAVSWSGQAVKKMKAALFTSIVYNLLLIPGAAFGWVTPGWAAVAMGLSSVSVVLVATSVRVEH